MNRKLKTEDALLIGSRIQNARRHAGMSQWEFAIMLDITRGHLSNIECGDTGLSIPLLLKICDILNVSADYILRGKVSESYESEDLTKFVEFCESISSDMRTKERLNKLMMLLLKLI